METKSSWLLKKLTSLYLLLISFETFAGRYGDGSYDFDPEKIDKYLSRISISFINWRII